MTWWGSMRIAQGVTQLVGHTPLIQLNHIPQTVLILVTYSPSRLTAEDGASNLTVKNFLSRRVLSRCSMSDLHPR